MYVYLSMVVTIQKKRRKKKKQKEKQKKKKIKRRIKENLRAHTKGVNVMAHCVKSKASRQYFNVCLF